MKDSGNPPAKTDLAIAGCPDYSTQNVQNSLGRLFDLLGGAEKFFRKGDRVLIKPNLIVPAGPDCPAQTHPAVITAVASLVKDCSALPMVGDSPAWGNTVACLNALGIVDELKKIGAEITPLNKAVRLKIDGSWVKISRSALDADRIINLPKLKSHQQLGATFAVKNMFGCVVGKQKPLWHFARGSDPARFCSLLIEIYKKLSPSLNIIDAVIAMEGQGPIRGESRHIGALIASQDPIACERLCCRLIRLDPEYLPIIQTAEKIGFGCRSFDQIRILGDDWQKFVCPDFVHARLTPLRFTLPGICKSVAKQALILFRNFFV